MAGDAHPDGLRCPSCRSTNVVCHGRPHGHECNDCGYDGAHPLDQALNLIRRHAEICSRAGSGSKHRIEAARIDILAERAGVGVAAGPQGTTPKPDPRCDHSGHDCTHYPPGYDQAERPQATPGHEGGR